MSVVCPVECVRAACPDPDFIERNTSFLLAVIAAGTGLIGVLLTYFLKSRCRNIRTPCISCDREVVELEAEAVTVTPAQT